jgi:flagellar basal-body rod modification protein FlgD
MASPVQGVSSNGAAGQTDTQTPSGSNIDALANENTFLQLLVAQLKNQDPLSPADGTQFVAQLAQFSELEQVMEIRSDIESMQASLQQAQAQTNGN